MKSCKTCKSSTKKLVKFNHTHFECKKPQKLAHGTLQNGDRVRTRIVDVHEIWFGFHEKEKMEQIIRTQHQRVMTNILESHQETLDWVLVDSMQRDECTVQIPVEITKPGRYLVLRSDFKSPPSVFAYNGSDGDADCRYLLDVQSKREDMVVVVGELENGARVRTPVIHFGESMQFRDFKASHLKRKYGEQEMRLIPKTLEWIKEVALGHSGAFRLSVSIADPGVYVL